MVPPLDSNRGVLHASPALSALSPPHVPRCLTSIRFKKCTKGMEIFGHPKNAPFKQTHHSVLLVSFSI